MKRFWAELISSLYSIKDGIIKKKQEDEAEKEELRNQIAELEQNSNNSQESIIVQPIAIGRQYEGDYIIEKFSQEGIVDNSDFTTLNSHYVDSLMFIYDRSQFNNDNNVLKMKQDKLYLISNYGDGVKSLNNGANDTYRITNLLDTYSNKLFNPITNSYDIEPNNAFNADNFIFEDLLIIEFDWSS